MTQHLSKEYLRALRNDIPVNWVIGTLLQIPSKTSENIFRFRCPVCTQWHTSTDRRTNLARCFSCQRNFNTIDITMLVRRLNFLQSVAFLRNSMGKRQKQQNHAAPKRIHTHGVADTGQLLSINEILRRIASSV